MLFLESSRLARARDWSHDRGGEVIAIKYYYSLSRIPAASRQRAAVQSPLGICDRVSRWQESPRSFHRDNDVSARNRTT